MFIFSPVFLYFFFGGLPPYLILQVEALLPNNPPLLKNNRALLKKVCLIFCG